MNVDASSTGMTRGQMVAAAFFFGTPFLASLGSVVTFAGLAAARPWTLATLAAVLLAAPKMNRTTRWVLFLAVLWTFSGLMNMHTPKAVRSFLGLPLSLLGVLATTLFPWNLDRLRWLSRGWLAAWFTAVLPALVELATGRHLPNYLSGSPAWIRERSDDIASYFVNPNPFAFFLCSAMIVLIATAPLEGPRLRRIMLACAGITPALIYFTNSRAILAISLVALVWLALTTTQLRRHARNAVVALALVIAFAMIFLMTNSTFTTKLLAGFERSGSSRLALYLNALWMYLQSWGRGIGPGMFEEVMRSGEFPYPTDGAINPHSGVFEILSQYGFLISALVGAALVALTIRCLRLLSSSYADNRAKPLLQGVLVAAVTLPALSFGDSRFLDSPIAWANICTMLAMWLTFTNTMKPLPSWAHRPASELPPRFRVARRALGRELAAEPSS
ncbi:O-antigen ligase [Arachnia propionica]|uniref:O-antigen ligase domain-containing protein n=1 Tax=Arachnia propionica TaxID=1750 RepID=A0A3P1WXD1_9ACTN|nr:O-antigen ligase family protein [Arachnia propionica]RRD49033.1 O-antigen ligase domain-containing protein [Arachnia propionica]